MGDGAGEQLGGAVRHSHLAIDFTQLALQRLDTGLACREGLLECRAAQRARGLERIHRPAHFCDLGLQRLGGLDAHGRKCVSHFLSGPLCCRCGFALLALSFIEGLSPGADILRVFHQFLGGLMLRLKCLLASQLLLGGGHHFDAQRGGFQVGWQGLHAGAHTLDRCIQVALGLRQAVGVNTHGPKRGSAGV